MRLCSSPLTVILRVAARPKNLIETRKGEILRSAQDDKMLLSSPLG